MTIPTYENLRYPHDDKPKFASDRRRYTYHDTWKRKLGGFIWNCPYPGCTFGPTDLEGAHDHLNAVHYAKENNASRH